MSESPRHLTVVAGPNGSGKTTFAEAYVAERAGGVYLSADAIAAELSPADPTRARVAAGREFLRRVDRAIGTIDELILESTLSGRTFRRVVQKARDAKYDVSIVYLYLDSANKCVDRVNERVLKGGHDVPAPDIRRRYFRSMWNFWNLYRPMTDDWFLYYNAHEQPLDVALGDSTEVSIRDEAIFSRFIERISEVP